MRILATNLAALLCLTAALVVAADKTEPAANGGSAETKAGSESLPATEPAGKSLGADDPSVPTGQATKGSSNGEGPPVSGALGEFLRAESAEGVAAEAPKTPANGEGPPVTGALGEFLRAESAGEAAAEAPEMPAEGETAPVTGALGEFLRAEKPGEPATGPPEVYADGGSAPVTGPLGEFLRAAEPEAAAAGTPETHADGEGPPVNGPLGEFLRDEDLGEAAAGTTAKETKGDGLIVDGPLGQFLSTDQPNRDPLAQMGEEVPLPEPDEIPLTEFGLAPSDPHVGLWTEDQYPSAESCRKCHPSHYEQWRSSGHAYAAVSPMFTRFEQAMTEYTRGTIGSFCVRCHLPVGTQLEIPSAVSILQVPAVVREGVTCIACHRVREHYWRSNGERRIEPGDAYQPIAGTSNGAAVAYAVSRADELKLKTNPHQSKAGQAIHRSSYFFEPLTNSDICVSCHQVAIHPGISVEVVHAQYRAGPAAKKGITCQNCHMGSVPGSPEGYEWGHHAEINGKPFGSPKRRSNHSFWGPGYSIAHPGIFPHNPDAKKYSPRDWLKFDYRAGWGTKQFESLVNGKMEFPKPWDTVDDRRDGRLVIEANLAKLEEKRGTAILTLQAGMDVSGPIMFEDPRAGRGLNVGYRVTNTSEGHNLPSGSLGAQPQLWLNVVLINPDGRRVWESGYLDRNGDLADMRSFEVASGQIGRDRSLFNLQTKFLISNVRGTDREVSLPLNFNLDQVILLRPAPVPVSVLNHPPLIRMEAHSIPPLDHRTAKYHIPASAFCKPGVYRLSVRMRRRTEPTYFMREVGSTPAMIRRMNENMLDVCVSSHTFTVR